MATHSFGTKLRATLLAALAAGAVVAVSDTARAEDVKPTGKGIVGGALLGGEVVTFGEAIFGVRAPLAYIIGAGVGMGGGGVGGYFLEKQVSDGRIPAYVLAGGLALLIPAVVVALDATRYMPPEGAREDRPVNLPASDPGKPGGSSVIGAEPTTPSTTTPPGTVPSPAPAPAPAPTTPPSGGGGGAQAPQSPQAALPPSLVNVTGTGFALGMPVPEVRPVLGATERARMGVADRGSELRFQVVSVTF